MTHSRHITAATRWCGMRILRRIRVLAYHIDRVQRVLAQRIIQLASSKCLVEN